MAEDYLNLPPPDEPYGARRSASGIVKWFKEDKGVGCISSDATAPWDIWVHHSHIQGEGYRSLREGQAVDVEFERADQDSFRYRAITVRSEA